jgi:hypothetical protein
VPLRYRFGNSSLSEAQGAVFQIVRKFTIEAKRLVVSRVQAQVNGRADEDEALARHFVCP